MEIQTSGDALFALIAISSVQGVRRNADVAQLEHLARLVSTPNPSSSVLRARVTNPIADHDSYAAYFDHVCSAPLIDRSHSGRGRRVRRDRTMGGSQTRPPKCEYRRARGGPRRYWSSAVPHIVRVSPGVDLRRGYRWWEYKAGARRDVSTTAPPTVLSVKRRNPRLHPPR